MRNSCLIGVLLIFILVCTHSVTAQNTIPIDTLKERYNRETLHLMYGYPAKGQSGERINHRDMKALFSISPDGWMAYEKYRSKKTTGIVLVSAAVTCLVGGILASKNNTKLSMGLVTTGLALEVLSAFSFKHSKEMLDRSIWLYNRDVLLQPSYSNGRPPGPR